MLTLRFATRNGGEKVVELLLIPSFFVHSITFQLTIFSFLTPSSPPLFLETFFDSYCRRVGFLNGGKWEYFFVQDWIEFRSLISLEISSMIEKEYIYG